MASPGEAPLPLPHHPSMAGEHTLAGRALGLQWSGDRQVGRGALGAGEGVGVVKMHEEDQNVQTSSYKINKPWGWNGDYS